MRIELAVGCEEELCLKAAVGDEIDGVFSLLTSSSSHDWLLLLLERAMVLLTLGYRRDFSDVAYFLKKFQKMPCVFSICLVFKGFCGWVQ